MQKVNWQAFRALILKQSCWLVCFLGVTTSAWAQLPAARVMAVSGSAKAVDAQGRERTLEKGVEVRSGEKIVTGEGALVQMRLNDGGYLSIRSGTEMVIDRFVYDEKNASNSNFLVSLIRGGFRSITGLIGKTNPDAYQIRTATATVGIRGTDHEPMVIPEGVAGMASLGAPGFYDKVNDGETFIRNRNGVLSLKRGDVGFAPVLADRPPMVLQKIPDFYKIEIKTDAREPRDSADSKGDAKSKAVGTGLLLRPSLAARGESLNANGTLLTTTPSIADKAIAPSTAILVSPVTSTLIAPSNTLIAPIATTTLVPTTTLITPTTTLIAPISTTTVAPTTTLISPITTISPTTTIIKSTTLLK